MGCTKVEISKERLSELMQAEHRFKSVEAMFRNYRTAVREELSRLHSTVDWASIAGVHIGKVINLESEINSFEARAIAAEQERDQLKVQMNSMKQAIDDLVRNSEGVAGLHQNGDVAPWDELLTGGRFEEWLCTMDDTPQQCLAAHDAEVIERAIPMFTGIGTLYETRIQEILQRYANQLRQQAKEVQS